MPYVRPCAEDIDAWERVGATAGIFNNCLGYAGRPAK
ncbi:hypothetical protein L5014_34815 [Paraburkholderia sp. RG36]|uniref:Uncharacterized protein n=1 Tax=Paraburkholderia tagetis TaxID=2913261 RepID=A0A9X1UNM8_9BURK|nr:hypothetical protein [Paraburkholderia tagetis]